MPTTNRMRPALLASCIAALALFLIPASNAGDFVPPCANDYELSTKSRQFAGTTVTYLRYFARQGDTILRNAKDDMDSATSDWGVYYAASRANLEMSDLRNRYVTYLDHHTNDIDTNWYDQCPYLFAQNLAFNQTAHSALAQKQVWFRDQIDNYADMLVTGTSGGGVSGTPTSGNGSVPGGRLSR